MLIILGLRNKKTPKGERSYQLHENTPQVSEQHASKRHNFLQDSQPRSSLRKWESCTVPFPNPVRTSNFVSVYHGAGLGLAVQHLPLPSLLPPEKKITRDKTRRKIIKNYKRDLPKQLSRADLTQLVDHLPFGNAASPRLNQTGTGLASRAFSDRSSNENQGNGELTN